MHVRRSVVAVVLVGVLLGGTVVTGHPAPAPAAALAGSMASAITNAPVRPPVCTKAQIAAVDLDNCALLVEGTPADHGFPVPPYPQQEIVATPITADQWTPLTVGSKGLVVTLAQRALKAYDPTLVDDGNFGSLTAAAVKKAQFQYGLEQNGVIDAVLAAQLGVLVTAVLGPFPPAGWVWNGNNFSGSPALAEWEARMVTFTVGTTKVTADPDVAALFQGFLTALYNGNYRIDEAGAYGFRCVATSVRNCGGMTEDKISYHAWGAALDLNWTQNPLQTVTDSVDACAKPAELNQPDWVLAAARHWGLYWGGWYSCPKAGAKSAVKDPHHFEFRGTPELARQILFKNNSPATANPAAPVLGDLLLHCGDRGAQVAELRQALPEQDRPNESPTLAHTFTTTLAAAVSGYQKRVGLPQTGMLDPATAVALGIPVRHTEVFPVLHMNSCGDAVKTLQTKLGVSQTGTFGTSTLTALRSWQKANGLPPSGLTDTVTAAKLRLSLAPASTGTTTTSATTSTSTTSTTVAPSSSTTPATSTTVAFPDGVRVDVPMSVGARGAAVKSLQEALTRAGYPVTATGVFGTVTSKQLRAFKKAHGLPVTATLTVEAARRLGLTPVPRVPTRYGQRGENVLALQLLLVAEGYTLNADGRFGPATRAALIAHQQQAGVKATGVLDAATLSTFG